MATNNTQDIKFYALMVIDNNKAVLYKKLRDAGYDIPLSISRADMFALLMDIFYRSKPQFISILSSVPYNTAANNYTTSPEFVAKMQSYLGEITSPTAKIDWNNVFGTVGDFLGGSSTTITEIDTTNPTTSKFPWGLVFVGIAVAAVAIVAIIYLRRN